MTPVATHQTATQPLDDARKLYSGRALDLLNAWRGMIRAGLPASDIEPAVKSLSAQLRYIARDARR